jgi:transcriptional regulator with XRE-family HTH domain
MRKKVVTRFKAATRPKAHFILEWRKFRHLTQDQLSERLREAQGLVITRESLSRIERGRQPYSETILRALAAELTGGDPASFLIRNPADPEGIWSIWDKARPAERKLIVELAKTLIKTGT